MVTVTRLEPDGCKANAKPAKDPAKNVGGSLLGPFRNLNILNKVRYKVTVKDVARAACRDFLFRRFEKIVLRLKLNE